jgi:hypothetical protein
MKGTLDRLDMTDPRCGVTLVPAEHAFMIAYRAFVEAELEPRELGSASGRLVLLPKAHEDLTENGSWQ